MNASSIAILLATVIITSKKEQLFGAPRYGTERWWQDVIHEEISLMPSFTESDLSSNEINDILSFLQSAQ